MGLPIKVVVKQTLDPNVRRFEVNRWLTGMGGRLYFAEKYRPQGAPRPKEGSLEAKIMDVDGVVSVYVYGTTVTVSKEPERSWDEIEPEIIRLLENAFTHYARAS